MKTFSIYRVKDTDGNILGLLKTESYIDIIDVVSRSDNKYGGDNIILEFPEYIGDFSE